MLRTGLIAAAVLAFAAFAIWRPAPQPAFTTTAAAVAPPSSYTARYTARPARSRRAVFADGPAVVYVVGAVRRPGLYHLAAGSRVDDAVRAAGGLLPGADPAGVNLAARVQDGDEIVAPVFGESVRYASRTTRSRGSRTRSTKTPHAIVNVNTATAGELATVPGIGATIAARIVEIREQEGAYTTFDELLDVAGMTDSRLDRASPYLQL